MSCYHRYTRQFLSTIKLLNEFKYLQMIENQTDETLSFKDINLDEHIIKNLEADNKMHPTHIQKLGIPAILSGKNIILTAETGCGKTLAFLIPILQQILQWKPLHDRGCNRPLGLILTPSRELAVQISVSLNCHLLTNVILIL